MKNITRHTGTLIVGGRLENSRNGNPRYVVRIDGVTCRTRPDSMEAYTIENLAGKTVTATIGTHYGKPTINSIVAA